MVLSFSDKLNIIKQLELNSQQDIADQYGVTQQCISYIKKSKKAIIDHINFQKSKTKGKNKENQINSKYRLPKKKMTILSAEIYKFCRKMLDCGVPIFGSVIKSKALKISQQIGLNIFWHQNNG